jgi:teichuronic acid biosynthesis glycosyltransferase TuaC
MGLTNRPEPASAADSPRLTTLAPNHRTRLRILSLSSNYPTSANPHRGTFIRSRLLGLAELADVRLLSPVALIDYGNRHRRLTPGLVADYREQSLQVHHFRWFYPPFGGILNAGFLFLRLVFNLAPSDQFQFDLIDSHFGFPDGIAASWLSRWSNRPYSITLRGNETLHAKSFFRGMALRRAIKHADGVVTVSSPLRDFALSCGTPPERVRVIPNGIDASIFHPRDSSEIRGRLEISGGIPLILSVGYLIERKGHHRVMRAARILLDEGFELFLAVVGAAGAEGDFRSELVRLRDELHLENNMRFINALPQPVLAELMSDAEVLCLASTREGWPNVVNEAMACGTPVVATDIGGVRDMIPSEDYGRIVAPNDQEALNRALGWALKKEFDRGRIARLGMSRSWSHVAAEVYAYFQEVVDRKTVGSGK